MENTTNIEAMTREEVLAVIVKATDRLKELDFKSLEGVIDRMEFSYPTNGAGGIGRESIEIDYKSQTVFVDSRSYGCDYNHPSLINHNEIDLALEKLGYELEIEYIDN